MPGTSAVWAVSVTLSGVAQANVSVTITNETNDETQQKDTDSSGQAIFNLANFTSGWTSGDVIETYAEYSTYEATDSRQATGSATILLALASSTAAALQKIPIKYGSINHEQQQANRNFPKFLPASAYNNPNPGINMLSIIATAFDFSEMNSVPITKSPKRFIRKRHFLLFWL